MKIYKYILIVLASVFLVGCFSNKYISRNQYLLDVPDASETSRNRHSCLVVIEPMSSIAPFDQLDFLYRTRGERFLIDYYNGFLVSPADQLDSILRAYFKKHAKFNVAVAESSASTRKLQTKIVEFYADYRDHNNPQAVVAIQFVLSDIVKGNTVVLLDQIFRSSIPLRAKNTEELLQAWNIGVDTLLRKSLRILNRKVSC